MQLVNSVLLSCLFVPICSGGLLGLGDRIKNKLSKNGTSECNGYVEYCDKPYSKIAFPATHNSFASVSGNLASNQASPISKQLEDGVRTFLIDFHNPNDKNVTKLINTSNFSDKASTLLGNVIKTIAKPLQVDKRSDDPDINLCHTSCVFLDSGKIELTLALFKTFMDENPNEVITIFIENFDNFTSTAILNKFVKSGLYSYLFNPVKYKNSQFSWPTLKTMISDNNKLVVFSDRNVDKEKTPWIMLKGDFIKETSFENTASTVSECKMSQTSKELSLLNHFASKNMNLALVDVQIPITDKLSDINSKANILGQYSQCQTSYPGFTANFVAVDYYNQGGLFEAVAAINNVTFKNLEKKFKRSSGSLNNPSSSSQKLKASLSFLAYLFVIFFSSNI